MPTFAYSGRTRAGQNVSGERMADTMDSAVSALRRDQILVTRITPSKAKVEVAVLVVERWILAPLRHRRFFSLVELNEAIAGLVADLNA